MPRPIHNLTGISLVLKYVRWAWGFQLRGLGRGAIGEAWSNLVSCGSVGRHTQDLHGDVVRATTLSRQLHQFCASGRGIARTDDRQNLRLLHQAPKTVGAQDQDVAIL